MHLMKSKWLLGLICFSLVSEAAEVFDINQFTTDGQSIKIATATDNDNNAVSVFVDAGKIQGTFSSGAAPWHTPNTLLSNSSSTAFSPDVAMDASGTALAIWREAQGPLNSINTKRFSNGAWQTTVIPALEFTVDGLGSPSIAMDGTKKALAVWPNTTANKIHASFFSNGVWSPFQDIGSGNNFPKAAYSLSGKAAAAWMLSPNSLYVNSFDGTSWLTATLLDNQLQSAPDLGIDASGNAIVIWQSSATDDIKVSRSDGTVFAAPFTLSTGSGNGIPRIAVAPDGTAVAIWSDGSGDIQFRVFNGTTWDPAVTLGPGSSPAISMDSVGNAIIAFTNPAKELLTALLPKGGIIGTPVTVTTFPNLLGSLDVALSHKSTLGVLVWNENDGNTTPVSNTFGTFVALGPTPPTDLEGSICNTKGFSNIDRVHIISWTASTDPTVVSYNIERDGVLVANVSADGPLVFFDHGRCKGFTNFYDVFAVNAEGLQGLPVSIALD